MVGFWTEGDEGQLRPFHLVVDDTRLAAERTSLATTRRRDCEKGRKNATSPTPQKRRKCGQLKRESALSCLNCGLLFLWVGGGIPRLIGLHPGLGLFLILGSHA